jgi:ABC-2 type transport system permease protein
MSRVRALALAELRLFLREPVTVLFTLALPLMVLYVLNGVFGQQQGGTEPGQLVVYRGFDAPDWYTPAYVAMAIAGFGLIAMPAHLVEYHESGVLRRFQASGVPKGAVLLSQAAVAMVVATVGCGLLVAAALAFTGATPPANPGLLLAAYLLTAVAVIAAGLLLGALLPTARAAQSVGLLAWFVSLFVSGGGPPPRGPSAGTAHGRGVVAADTGHPDPSGAVAHRRVGDARLARDARHRRRCAGGGVARLPVGLSRHEPAAVNG